MPSTARLHLINKFLVLVALIYLSSCAKTDTDASKTNVDYIKAYHPLIHAAELQIVEQEFANALQLYKQAFAAVPEPFAIDYYNAAVSAMLAENQKQALSYLEKLALKGVSLEYIEKQEVFSPLQETKEWSKFLKAYAKNESRFNRRADLDLRADLDELYAKDQFFRQAKGGLRVNGDTIKKIEASNVEFLLGIIEKHGYPGEALIGVADTLEQLPRFSIVIQRQTKATNGYNFEPILKEAVQSGRIRPQAAAYLLEQQGQGTFNSKAFVTVSCSNSKNCEGADFEGKYFRDRLTNSQLGVLNASRSQLGLSSFPDYRRKVLYNMQDKRFKLSSYWSIANYVVPSKEAASALTEKLVIANVKD